MRYTICAYFDKGVEHFLTPFVVPFTKEDTAAQVVDGVKKGQIKDPEHVLFFLGYYESDDGSFELLEKPEKMLEVSDYVRKEISNA